jgi:hypothetical protein
MRVRVSALLCELHAHTTWSDGELSLAQLVDLYGRAGFDVLCVTDHVLRSDDPWPSENGRLCVNEGNFAAYLAEIERERVRALSMFGLLLVPGLELTYNDPDSDCACHAVAIAPRRLVGMDDGPAAAMEQARDLGAAIVDAAALLPPGRARCRAAGDLAPQQLGIQERREEVEEDRVIPGPPGHSWA